MTRSRLAHRTVVLALVAAGCNAEGFIGAARGGDSGASIDSGSSGPDAAQVPDARLPPPDASTPDASIPDASIPDARPACIDGNAQVEDPDTGRCYMLFTQQATWSAAQLTCASVGAYLVVSTSKAENDRFSPLAGLADVWAGGTDLDDEGQWRWHNGEPMAYTNWRSGEPNNSNNNEHCMVIEGDNGGLWDDRPCGRTYGFICERE